MSDIKEELQLKLKPRQCAPKKTLAVAAKSAAGTALTAIFVIQEAY